MARPDPPPPTRRRHRPQRHFRVPLLCWRFREVVGQGSERGGAERRPEGPLLPPWRTVPAAPGRAGAGVGQGCPQTWGHPREPGTHRGMQACNTCRNAYKRPHTCRCTHVHACKGMHMHARMHKHAHVHAHACTHVRACKCTYMQGRARACVQMNTHACTPTHTCRHTCMHMHVHVHTCRFMHMRVCE